MKNFDIKRFLIENKMTRNSRLLTERYADTLNPEDWEPDSGQDIDPFDWDGDFNESYNDEEPDLDNLPLDDEDLYEGQDDVISNDELIELANKAGEYVLDAKDALHDLIVSGEGETIPKRKVEQVLAMYDISLEDLMGSEEENIEDFEWSMGIEDDTDEPEDLDEIKVENPNNIYGKDKEKNIDENQPAPSRPTTKPTTKPGEKTRRRTLQPPKEAPKTTPKAEGQEMNLANKIGKRFNSLKQEKILQERIKKIAGL